VDDPVSAVSVHASCGIVGTLLVGFLAVDGGLFNGGNADQLLSQIILEVSVSAWVIVTTGILFWTLKDTVGPRVSEEEEREGLDSLEHGYPATAPACSRTWTSSRSR